MKVGLQVVVNNGDAVVVVVVVARKEPPGDDRTRTQVGTSEADVMKQLHFTYATTYLKIYKRHSRGKICTLTAKH